MNKKILFSLFIIYFVFSASVFAADYSVTQYNIYADVMENGDIKIKEEIVYDFDDDMNGVYRELLYNYTYNEQKDDLSPASKRYQASKIEDLSVWYSDSSFEKMNLAFKKDESELSNGMNGYYSLEEINQEEKKQIIKVYTPAEEDSKKYIRYIYTVKDVVVNYNDYAELYWNFIGGDWQCTLRNVKITVNLPQETNVRAFYHTYANISQFKNDGNTITLEIPTIYSGIAVDIRAVFPNNILRMSNLFKQKNENYDFDELAKVEEGLKNNIENYRKYNGIFFVTLAINIVLFILTMIFIGKPKDGRIKKYKKAEVFTDIPEEYILEEYYKIYSPYNSYLNGNFMIATLMNLAHKKIIKLDCRKKINKNKDEYEYYVSLNKNSNFEKLTEFETIIINYIFFKKSSDTIDISIIDDKEFELNARFKELSKNTSLAEKVRNKVTKLESKQKDNYYDNAKFKRYVPALIIALIMLLVYTIPLFAICPAGMRSGYLAASLVITIFFVIFTSLKVAINAISIKENYLYSYNSLKGLYKYLMDYSLLKERYPIEIALWDKYMVYACMFGIAKKVAKEFKEELVAGGMNEEDIYSYYPYMYIGNNISVYSSGISSAAYSGAGSSSSGGFAGSGGGGRRRRWWWRLLNRKNTYKDW